MPFHGHVDEANQFALHGWLYCVSHPALVPSVDIVVNRRLITRVLAGIFRHDLAAENFADGCRAFWFNPFESLKLGPNVVEIFISGSDQLVPNGRHVVASELSADRSQFANSEERARLRWTQDEAEHSLTWGRVMTGDSFLDQVDRFFQFAPPVRILEIGPGYGRLLKTILQRAYPFQEFLGLDLSKARVDRLTGEFGDHLTSFVEGACDSYRAPSPFDLVISSATCEHLFPSIAATLTRIYESLKPGGMVFLDFICHDPDLAISRAYFEENLGEAFIRIYSETELRMFFVEAGFEVLDIVYPMVTGLDIGLNEVKRALVAARKPEVI